MKRLGITVSVLWMLIAMAAAYIQYTEVKIADEEISFGLPDSQAYRIESRHLFFDTYKKARFTFEEAKGFTPLHDRLVVRVSNLLLFCFGPVVALWVVGTSAFWVIDGFRTNKNT
ncbi:MAG: hypothetical protein L0Y67_08810 [Gammaproteobacteria bacterium]|nr:hypothetical protein [Gammaproteobacteria bacterium]MCI0591671.1 hypothetical protein [Gammaproteobacteria bacterium]